MLAVLLDGISTRRNCHEVHADHSLSSTETRILVHEQNTSDVDRTYKLSSQLQHALTTFTRMLPHIVDCEVLR